MGCVRGIPSPRTRELWDVAFQVGRARASARKFSINRYAAAAGAPDAYVSPDRLPVEMYSGPLS